MYKRKVLLRSLSANLRGAMNIASGGVVATAHNDITIYCP